jgi:hypothetical protein
LDGVEAGPVVEALVAVTVKVYDCPAVSPPTVVEVVEPDTVVVACAVEPM